MILKFEEHCNVRKIVVWLRWQKEGEPFDHWVKELRLMAKDCQFKRT